MKTKQILLSIILLLNLSLIRAQESEIEKLKSEINQQEAILIESLERFDLLTLIISEIENAEGDNEDLIKTKKEELRVLEISILITKGKLFDLKQKMDRLSAANVVSTNNIDIQRLEAIEKQINSKIAAYELNEKTKKAFKNKKIKYKATIWNTNFSIPIARFNFDDDENDLKFGDIQMFNSIGAGFGMSWGTMTDYRDENGDLENSDFVNSFSIHGGFLFSAGSENNNVFAPVVTIGVLDFQLGLGVELGTISENQRRTFLTLGYAIPLYKLTRGKYLFHKKGRILNEVNTDL